MSYYKTNIDGVTYILGENCCNKNFCRYCKTGRTHYQGVYGGFIEVCENCEIQEWELVNDEKPNQNIDR
jgi:hypothetical protein